MASSCKKSGAWAFVALLLFALTLYGTISVLAVLRMNSNDEFSIKGPLATNLNAGAGPDDQPGDILVYLHVSDIHISAFNKYREEQLRKFAQDVVGSIQPRVVVATGDLVDGHDNPERRLGAQLKQEWERYRGVLEESGVVGPKAQALNLTWLDTRGNHGTYGSGLETDPSTNLYEQYGISSAQARGEDDTRTWRHDVVLDSGEIYRIVGLDASIGPGVSKPFNFFGYLSSDVRGRIMSRLNEAPANGAKVQGSVLVGHHPDQSIVGGLGSEIRDAFPYYLCGHLHSKTMKQRLGKMVELEVDDMKEDQSWRLVAIDNGQLSFSENKLDQWPVGVITNPKNARYLNELEPFYATSSHIRVLAYTSLNESIASVQISIDNDVIGNAVPQAGTNDAFYSIAWDPSLLDSNALHTVSAVIIDSQGRQAKLEHQFSLDGSSLPFERTSGQISQAVGDSSLLFRVMMVGIALVNVVLSIMVLSKFTQRNPRALIIEDVMVVFIAISATLLLFLPYLIGFFMTKDGPLCFVFTWGIAVAGQGIAVDAQATLLGALFHFFIMTPALYYCIARTNRAMEQTESNDPNSSTRSVKRLCLALTGNGKVWNVSSKTRDLLSAKARWGCFLAAYYFFVVLVGLALFMSSQVIKLWFLLISPGAWATYTTFALVLLDFSRQPLENQTDELALIAPEIKLEQEP